ncbi:MAG: hypothetical protein ACPHUL_00860 [Marinomonas gallaica]
MTKKIPVTLQELEEIAVYYMTHSCKETAKHFKRSTSIVHRAAKTFCIKKYGKEDEKTLEEKLDAKHCTVEVPHNINQKLWTPPPSAKKYEVTRCLR